MSLPPSDVPLDPDLAARLRDLADARVREQVARAAEARETAVAARAQQARRRTWGVTARNAAKAARLRLTERHQLPPGNRQVDRTNQENTVDKPAYLTHAQALIVATIIDTTSGNHPAADDNAVNGATRRLLNSTEYSGLGGNDLSLLVAIADYAAKAVIDLAHATGKSVDTTWDQLTAAFSGYVGPVVADECRECHVDGDYSCTICFPGNETRRPLCPLHDDPTAVGDSCTCDSWRLAGRAHP